jgi:hypothetical protein
MMIIEERIELGIYLLKNNHFIMFPATNKYCITENTSKKLNTILTIGYEYI